MAESPTTYEFSMSFRPIKRSPPFFCWIVISVKAPVAARGKGAAYEPSFTARHTPG